MKQFKNTILVIRTSLNELWFYLALAIIALMLMPDSAGTDMHDDAAKLVNRSHEPTSDSLNSLDSNQNMKSRSRKYLEKKYVGYMK